MSIEKGVAAPRNVNTAPTFRSVGAGRSNGGERLMARYSSLSEKKGSTLSIAKMTSRTAFGEVKAHRRTAVSNYRVSFEGSRHSTEIAKQKAILTHPFGVSQPISERVKGPLPTSLPLIPQIHTLDYFAKKEPVPKVISTSKQNKNALFLGSISQPKSEVVKGNIGKTNIIAINPTIQRLETVRKPVTKSEGVNVEKGKWATIRNNHIAFLPSTSPISQSERVVSKEALEKSKVVFSPQLPPKRIARISENPKPAFQPVKEKADKPVVKADTALEQRPTRITETPMQPRRAKIYTIPQQSVKKEIPISTPVRKAKIYDIPEPLMKPKEISQVLVKKPHAPHVNRTHTENSGKQPELSKPIATIVPHLSEVIKNNATHITSHPSVAHPNQESPRPINPEIKKEVVKNDVDKPSTAEPTIEMASEKITRKETITPFATLQVKEAMKIKKETPQKIKPTQEAFTNPFVRRLVALQAQRSKNSPVIAAVPITDTLKAVDNAVLPTPMQYELSKIDVAPIHDTVQQKDPITPEKFIQLYQDRMIKSEKEKNTHVGEKVSIAIVTEEAKADAVQAVKVLHAMKALGIEDAQERALVALDTTLKQKGVAISLEETSLLQADSSNEETTYTAEGHETTMMSEEHANMSLNEREEEEDCELEEPEYERDLKADLMRRMMARVAADNAFKAAELKGQTWVSGYAIASRMPGDMYIPVKGEVPGQRAIRPDGTYTMLVFTIAEYPEINSRDEAYRLIDKAIAANPAVKPVEVNRVMDKVSEEDVDMAMSGKEIGNHLSQQFSEAFL